MGIYRSTIASCALGMLLLAGVHAADAAVTMGQGEIRLARSIFLQNADERGLDQDHDGLVDALELELAESFAPYLLFDSREGARRTLSGGEPEPITLFQVRESAANDATTDYLPRPSARSGGGPDQISIRWAFLFAQDDGYLWGFCAWDDHPGDADNATFDLQSSDGGLTWKLVRVALSEWNPGPVWPLNSGIGFHDDTHPKIYPSADKHHLFLNTAYNEEDSPYSNHACNDAVNGKGYQALANLRSLSPDGNNIGEPQGQSHHPFDAKLAEYYPYISAPRPIGNLKPPTVWGSETFYHASIVSNIWFQTPMPQDLDGDQCATATPMPASSAMIDHPGDRDYFRIELDFPGELTLFSTADATDTYGELMNDSCAPIAHNDDGGSGRNFRLDLSLQAGVYYLAVSHYSPTGLGYYPLAHFFTPENDDHANTLSGATPLSMPANGFGAASFSRIDYGGDKDVFELTVTVGGILRFFTLGQTDTFGELHSDNGFLLSDDDSGSGNNFDLRRPVAPGRYFIVVRHYDASKSGDYQLYLDFDAGDDVGNACQSATHIALSGRTYGAIGHAGDEDYFRIQASGAGSVRIRTQGPTDTYGSLLNSACQVVASDDDSGPEANFEIFKNLPAGSYYIAVRHYRSTAMGNYTLYLNPID